MLGPESRQSDRLRDFIERRGLSVWFFDDGSLHRAVELMERYADHPMDLADASLVAAAEWHVGEGLERRVEAWKGE